MTGRRLVLGNGDVRISYVVGAASPRRSTATRSATSACTSSPAAARVETVFGAPRRRRRRLRASCPRATTHRWVPTGDEPLRPYAIEANGHIAPAQALPVAVRPAARARALLRARPARPRRAAAGRRRAPTSRCSSSTAARAGRARRHRSTSAAPPVRRRRLGRLPLPVRVQRRRLRADHRAGAPAAAGAPGVRGPQLRDLQLRAAQGRLPPAGHPGAVLPLQRRLRRGHVLRRRQLRGPQGLGHRQGSISLHPGGHSHGPQPGAVERSLGAESFDELAVMVDTFRPLELGEGGAGRARTAGYAWTWAGGDRRHEPTALRRRSSTTPASSRPGTARWPTR